MISICEINQIWQLFKLNLFLGLPHLQTVCVFNCHRAACVYVGVCVCVFALQKDTAYCTACSKNEFLEAYKSC